MTEGAEDFRKDTKDDPENGARYHAVYLVAGYTDLRYGLRSLSTVLEVKLGRGGIKKDTLYLFCGRRMDYLKGVVWKEDQCILFQKRLEREIQWPRTDKEAAALTPEQRHFLTEGLPPAVTRVLRNTEQGGHFAALNIRS